MNLARERALPIAVHGGGHGVTGASMCDAGIVVDLRGMKGIAVDPGRAGPHEAAFAVDQGAGGAVADGKKVERLLHGPRRLPSPRNMICGPPPFRVTCP